jgi:catechol 2,3-dioxygenase-like lactoylglutathione lyase family enzyme
LTDVDASTILDRIDNRQFTREVPVSRVQIALNVSDLDAAIDFYSKLFASTPAKVRSGYANFAIVDPPLKLVLVETPEGRGSGIGAALNHLGVEVEDAERVAQATSRLSCHGLAITEEHETTCCYAVQDKVWVEDPDATPWEVYAVLADALAEAGSCRDGTSICCQLQDEVAPTATTCC